MTTKTNTTATPASILDTFDSVKYALNIEQLVHQTGELVVTGIILRSTATTAYLAIQGLVTLENEEFKFYNNGNPIQVFRSYTDPATIIRVLTALTRKNGYPVEQNNRTTWETIASQNPWTKGTIPEPKAENRMRFKCLFTALENTNAQRYHETAVYWND